ncbi:aminotransferase class I/II-fold pyridoxal phosphate-dependent enzyme [Enhygromyxa salina]|uniref:Putative pyridoxal phosphate-dependent acyltransferase n=1 Tax=Enhygromyxa salina TaxID=215803 RepID=A0A2S9YTX2_9BACT|nr:aminotransferase class I/II-fold pyridoxal phosphate-dependent enzyme [Enhygromyxa salina]PRQ08534.1 putative pyridoxal phosphate-dependent acyltransferase [Enhygromyxa salina]
MKDNKIATISRVMRDASARDLVHHTIEDERLDGRTIRCGDRTLLNFGTCNYLALEHHEALAAGVRDALERYGTQFSSSRAFTSIPLYDELEDALAEIFAKPVIVTPSTTLGHLAALPTIVGEKDAVIIDLQVHNSVQTAVQLLKADGVHVEVIRHNSMTALERKLDAYKGKYDKVWYLADGVYSIFGDSAPLAELERLLDRHPHFHLYIDDAHGMGWTGDKGCGWVRGRMAHHERMVLAVSLNKSFAAAGGALVLPNEAMARQIRDCGGPMTFSGPIQPPMLGAALASARLHASPEIREHQARLAELIAFANRSAQALGVPQYEVADTPVFFVPLGLPTATFKMVERLKADGFYTHGGSFPATPMKQSGLRFMLNAHQREADVLRLFQRIRYHYPMIMAEEGTSGPEVARHFGIAAFTVEASAPLTVVSPSTERLEVELVRSVDELDGEEWDRLFAGAGNLGVGSLRSMERVFADANDARERADFYYCIVRDGDGHPVLATVFTHALMKDDLFAPAGVSEQIEARRAADPLYLTSPTISLGAPITRGRHLVLDRAHPAWAEALRLLVRELEDAMQTHGATQMLLRDFVGDEDEELSATLYELGFTPASVPAVSRVEGLDWADRDAYMRRLSSRYRSDLRREVLRFEDQLEVVTSPPRSAAELRACYRLYLEVFERSLEMNVFPLPYRFFAEICANPSYDFIRLYRREDLAEDPGAAPIAVMFSSFDAAQYNALIVGLDYRYVRPLNTYKQILFQTVMRARALGCASLDLAFTASAVKKKVGGVASSARVYMQILDHFNLSVIDSIARKAG